MYVYQIIISVFLLLNCVFGVSKIVISIHLHNSMAEKCSITQLFSLNLGNETLDRIEAINLDDTTIELQVTIYDRTC